ncbi:MAG: aminotransferase class I/II-fold pyridoxal phosphate-dependent enzyme [Candidatus Atribacteria bacterium]|nr:aminotransferase class I/II-fold pyridoxal phosphate-dependent enzyme [Candidatus Atribacteria bacterium]
MIDLRSDTQTRPTEEMYQAMINAPLGDEQNEEDPTVMELQKMAAEILGKEDALFTASGTMGNLVALMVHTSPGESVLMEEETHIMRCETGGLAVVAGLMLKTVPGELGCPKLDLLEKAIIGEGRLFATSSLICLENTHNAAGGTCISVEQMNAIAEIAKKHNLKIHVDGARIFNAAIALGIEPAHLVQKADSVQFCLSKSLGCPYGSMLVGTKEFIAKARKKRQILGGGMRQGGVMAAAGIIALDKMIDRLSEDHENARILADGLLEVGMQIDMRTIQTNLVFFEVPTHLVEATELVRKMKDKNVLIGKPSGNRIRVVTHKDISRDDVIFTIESLKEILK